MTLSNWLQRLRSGRMNCKATGRRRRVARTAAVALESLEPRVLLSSLQVGWETSGLSFHLPNHFDPGTGSLHLFADDPNVGELAVTVDPETDHVLVNGNPVNALGHTVPLLWGGRYSSRL